MIMNMGSRNNEQQYQYYNISRMLDTKHSRSTSIYTYNLTISNGYECAIIFIVKIL